MFSYIFFAYLTEYLGVGAESRVGELGSIIGTGEAEGDTSPLNPYNTFRNMEGTK
jgi:hypothetical protein